MRSRFLVGICLSSGISACATTQGPQTAHAIPIAVQDARDAALIGHAWESVLWHADRMQLLRYPVRAPKRIHLVDAEDFLCGTLRVAGCVNWDQGVYVARQRPNWVANLVHELIGYLCWQQLIDLPPAEEDFLKDERYWKLKHVTVEHLAGLLNEPTPLD